jgi:ABC-2 type transport system permease protein
MTTTAPKLQLTPQGGPRPADENVQENDFDVVRVSVPPRSAASEARAIKIVWQRELRRFWDDRVRIVVSLLQPFLLLFILGGGLSKLASGGTHGVALRTFIYPGILCLAVMFPAMFSVASFVWDREFGFLREMMIAPVRRSSIILGKAIGSATVASIQGILVLAIAGVMNVPYRPLMLLGAYGLQLLLALMIATMSLTLAVRVRQMQTFMGLMQVLILPMFFLSGALFPPSGLPTWLSVVNRLDPVTYAVDPMRRLILGAIHISPAAHRALDSGVTWGAYHLPVALEIAILLALSLVSLAIAVRGFSRSE